FFFFLFQLLRAYRDLHSFPTRRSSDLEVSARLTRCHFAVTAGNGWSLELACVGIPQLLIVQDERHWPTAQRLEEEGAAVCLGWRSEEHTSELQSPYDLVCRLLLEKKKK